MNVSINEGPSFPVETLGDDWNGWETPIVSTSTYIDMLKWAEQELHQNEALPDAEQTLLHLLLDNAYVIKSGPYVGDIDVSCGLCWERD